MGTGTLPFSILGFLKEGKKNEVVGPSADQLALSNLMRGIHF